jgi:hypothetical protein
MLIEDIVGRIGLGPEVMLTAPTVHMLPLVLQLSNRYQLTASHSNLFHLWFVQGTTKFYTLFSMISMGPPKANVGSHSLAMSIYIHLHLCSLAW